MCTLLSHSAINYYTNIRQSMISYTAQYPVFRIGQSSTLQFYFLTDLFNREPSRLLWEASSHAAIIARRSFVAIYQPLSIARYSPIYLSVLEQCWVNKVALGRLHRTRTRGLLVENPTDVLATAPLRHCATAPLRHCATAPMLYEYYTCFTHTHTCPHFCTIRYTLLTKRDADALVSFHRLFWRDAPALPDPPPPETASLWGWLEK